MKEGDESMGASEWAELLGESLGDTLERMITGRMEVQPLNDEAVEAITLRLSVAELARLLDGLWKIHSVAQNAEDHERAQAIRGIIEDIRKQAGLSHPEQSG